MGDLYKLDIEKLWLLENYIKRKTTLIKMNQNFITNTWKIVC